VQCAQREAEKGARTRLPFGIRARSQEFLLSAFQISAFLKGFLLFLRLLSTFGFLLITDCRLLITAPRSPLTNSALFPMALNHQPPSVSSPLLW
jgi:hypothetical protein